MMKWPGISDMFFSRYYGGTHGEENILHGIANIVVFSEQQSGHRFKIDPETLNQVVLSLPSRG